MSVSIASEIRCTDATQLLDLYIDGELDAPEARELEVHLERCAQCADKEERRRNTRQSLRALSTATPVSADFQQRLKLALDNEREQGLVWQQAPSTEEANTEIRRLPSMAQIDLQRFRMIPWLAAAALTGAFIYSLSQRAFDGEEQTTELAPAVAGVASISSPAIAESVAWHRRNVPIEIAGPSPQRVRNWFSTKVSFAVNVPEFGHDVRLLGGRLSHVRHHEAAYLLYEVDGSKLSVLMFDADDLGLNGLSEADAPFIDNSDGYNVAVVRRNGVTYTVTSDLSNEELSDVVGVAFPTMEPALASSR